LPPCFIWDPAWIAAVLSGIAAVLAALAWLKSGKSDPASVAAVSAVSELSTRVEQLRTLLADNSQRDRQDAEARARLFRDEIGAQIKDGFTRFDDASRGLRGEVIKLVTTLGETTAGSVGKLGQVQSEKLGDTVQRVQSLSDTTERRLTDVKKEAAESGKALREEVNSQLQALLVAIRDTLQQIGTTQKESLDQVGDQLRQLTQRNIEMNEQLRKTIEERLEILRKENETKLEEMRRTVDEKLQDTLEARLSSSFKQVSDLLEQVFKSVGQMQALADDVDDLSRVLTNVKPRGTWAEVWLGNLLEQVMAPEQFQRNVEIKPGSGKRVDFAIKLPGQGEESTIWLPIDSKFPTEDYEALVEASGRGDAAAVEIALKKLETRIRNEGADICDKYICPPETTDFAILYLPTEGLYAEVIRRPGLLDDLQRKCRIVVAGPTVLLALLNSLRLGFRTLAIQKRSSEVWQLLAAVKTEFGKYGDVLKKVQKKLTEASDQIENELSRRKRAIDRKLKGVEQLPDLEAQQLLQIEEAGGGLDEELEAADPGEK
jgi:DNA recombination protein RmuC